MIKYLKYILVVFSTIISCTNASVTAYILGAEEDKARNDIVRVGSAGGFSGFTNPTNRRCNTLSITFVQSGTTAAPNITSTSVSSLSKTIKDIWFEGDATGFDTLVSGGTQYAFPTPFADTTIHFLLSKAPTTNPLSWFQGDLPAGCRLVIEPGSVDPFINSVLPLAGGYIIVGSSVAPEVGFSALLNSASAPCIIQRHPHISTKQAYQHAKITIAENTTFPNNVNGISLAGPYQATFKDDSDLVDPAADCAEAGFIIAPHQTLQIFSSSPERPLPGIRSLLEAGGTANIKIAKTAVTIPQLKPPLNPHL